MLCKPLPSFIKWFVPIMIISLDIYGSYCVLANFVPLKAVQEVNY